MCKLLIFSIQQIYGPERPGDIKHSNANTISVKAKNHPEYDVNKGLKKAIEWYKGNL